MDDSWVLRLTFGLRDARGEGREDASAGGGCGAERLDGDEQLVVERGAEVADHEVGLGTRRELSLLDSAADDLAGLGVRSAQNAVTSRRTASDRWAPLTIARTVPAPSGVASVAVTARASRGELLPVWGGALLLVAYAVVLSVVAARLTLRHDLS